MGLLEKSESRMKSTLFLDNTHPLIHNYQMVHKLWQLESSHLFIQQTLISPGAMCRLFAVGHIMNSTFKKLKI